jgi:hypothetical protein
MPKQEIDKMRSGVKATMIPWTEPPLYLENSKWHGPPGAFLTREGTGPSSWLLCCPGCGEAGSPRTGAVWTATKGSFDDVSGLTLRPSIQKNCCGWHGYLNSGVFELQMRD